MSKKDDIIDRGVQADQLLKNQSYTKVMNWLVDEAISTWATTKLEQKELREGAWHRYQAIVAVQGTLQSWITAMEQEQKAQETKTNSKELN